MDNIETLLERFVDDRDQLSDEELDELVEAAGTDEQFAARLKDQLVIDELLAQRMAIDRRDFVAQVAQRIRDDDVGVVEPAPVDPEIAGQMRDLMDVELAQRQKQARRRRANRWAWWGAAAALLLLVGAGLWLVQFRPQPVAVVQDVSGAPTLLRGSQLLSVSTGLQLLSGDKLSTLPEESLTFSYSDGTQVRLSSDTSVTVQGESSSQGKQIFLSLGALTADVTRQPPGRPMQLETRFAEVSVRGTTFWLAADDDFTRLDVTQGVVEIARKTDTSRVAVTAQEFAMASDESLSVKPLTWPVDRRDAVVLLETFDTTSLVRGEPPDAFEDLDLRPHGAARLNHNFAPQLADGHFGLQNASAAVLNSSQVTGELSVELTISPESIEQAGPACILACARDFDSSNFMLLQDENRLLFSLATSEAQGAATGEPIELCRITAGVPQHVAVTYRPGALACYLNGRRVYHESRLQGDLTPWQRYPITIGATYSGQHDWAGTLEGLAIYDRALSEDEIQRNADLYHRLMTGRHAVPVVEMEATLLEKSRIVELGEILPQDSALVVSRYRVDKVLSGELEENQVLVAEWSIIDAKPQPIASAPAGTVKRLRLERLGLNAQLEGVIRSDDFNTGDDPQKPRYYSVGPP